VTIPAGTRVAKAGTQIYFATDGVLVISDDATTGSAGATCLTNGISGNDFQVGEVSAQVDVIAGVSAVANTDITAHGSDIEDDEHLRARIRLAPTAFSCAGSRDSYEFWARSASPLIADVSVVSPTPGQVDVYALLANGEVPDAGMLTAIEAIISEKTVRPLTDNVTAKAPDPITFSVEVTYYVNSNDAARAADIEAAVGAAVTAYVAWQISAIGRDVNPSQLTALMMTAGAKRVDITTPAYAAVADTEVAAVDGEVELTYGGLEDE
jgi:phage-related baseplate assembly protein